MTIEMDEIVKARLGDELEKELKKNANFLQKQLEWRDAANRFDAMVSMTHEQWLALQEVEEVFLDYNASYGEAAYRQGLSDGISIGAEQEVDGRKSVLALEDMTNLISVYDAVRQLKKVLLGSMDERWEDVGAFSVFELIFNVIDNATCSKIQFLGKDEAIEVVTSVLDDKTMESWGESKAVVGNGVERLDFLMALYEYLWYNQIVITGENLLIQSLRLDYIKSKDKNATCVVIHARAGRVHNVRWTLVLYRPKRSVDTQSSCLSG